MRERERAARLRFSKERRRDYMRNWVDAGISLLSLLAAQAERERDLGNALLPMRVRTGDDDAGVPFGCARFP